jgi:predicted negative regulator of RcsB-dependent stress response
MMDDYLTEAEQWERAKAWLKVNIPWIIAGVAIAVVGISGWRWWQGRQDQNLAHAARLYDEMAAAFDKNDAGNVGRLAKQLDSEFTGTGYADHAALVTARMNVQDGKKAQAIEDLQKLMTSTKDKELALVVRLRLARVQIDEKKPDDAMKTLEGAMPGAFAARFAEVRGDALYAKGDRQGALKAYREALQPNDPTIDSELLTLKINSLASS